MDNETSTTRPCNQQRPRSFRIDTANHVVKLPGNQAHQATVPTAVDFVVAVAAGINLTFSLCPFCIASFFLHIVSFFLLVPPSLIVSDQLLFFSLSSLFSTETHVFFSFLGLFLASSKETLYISACISPLFLMGLLFHVCMK